MKRLLYFIPLILTCNLFADTTNSGIPGTINISTSAQDRTRNIGDKINENFRMISATMSTLNSTLSNILSTNIANGTILSEDIANRTILGEDIAANTIEGVSLRSDIVVSSHIVDGQVTGSDLGSGVVFSSNIADGQIRGSDIANEMIVSSHVVQGSLNGTDMSTSTILNITSGTFSGTVTSTTGFVGNGSTLTFNGRSYTWPSADGADDEVLTTNGSGVLTWETDNTSAGGAASVQTYRFVIGTAASQNPTHIGTNQAPFIAVSTSLEALGGGSFLVREGSYTWDAQGVTIPVNVEMVMSPGVSIAFTGHFEAFIVSGTIRGNGVRVELMGGFSNRVFHIKSSAVVEGITIQGGSLNLGGTANPERKRALFFFETGGYNIKVRDVQVRNVQLGGAGSICGVFVGSSPVNLDISNWVIDDFSGNNNAGGAFVFSGGQNVIVRDGRFYGRNQFLYYDGESSGTYFINNTIEPYGAQGYGAITSSDFDAVGNTNNLNFINNRFIGKAPGFAATLFIYLQGAATAQVRGGRIHGNTFHISGSQAIALVDTNVIGMTVTNNVFMSSGSFSDAGTANAYDSNFLSGTNARYPQNSP